MSKNVVDFFFCNIKWKKFYKMCFVHVTILTIKYPFETIDVSYRKLSMKTPVFVNVSLISDFLFGIFTTFPIPKQLSIPFDNEPNNVFSVSIKY